jgi:hypothetical protein
MKKKAAYFFTVIIFLFQCYFAKTADRAVLVHNTIQEIEKCKGKLQLKLIRVWGGDEEEDENKFFETPISIAIDSNRQVYICDCHSHCIKVFNNPGDYVRTIGQKGQGPGDLYGPEYITFSTVGDLVVNDGGNRRIQWFSPYGKSKHILKQNEYLDWIGVLPENEIAVYDHLKTFKHRTLISIINNKGKVLREIGKYHDTAKNLFSSERLHFAIDEEGNIYAANQGTPVIRKYSNDGKLIRVITFDTPFDIPVEITLNSSEDEIERKENSGTEDNVKITRSNLGISIQNNKKENQWKFWTCMGIGIDSKNRIYIVKRRRILTEKEEYAKAVYGSLLSGINRSRVNYDIVEKNDFNHTLVFDSNGKIIAEAQLTTLCDDIYIHDNRIFVIDGVCNQRVMEYEISFSSKINTGVSK